MGTKLKRYETKRGAEHCLWISETGRFYYRGPLEEGGPRKTKSLDTNKLGIARKERDQILKNLGKIESRTESALLVSDVIEDIVDWKREEGLSDSTITGFRVCWKLVEPFWGSKRVDEFDRKTEDQFKKWFRKTYPEHQTKNPFKYLQQIGTYMAKREIISHMPPEFKEPKDKVLQQRERKGRYITKRELNKILKYADPDTSLLIRLAYSYGFRKMELGALEWSRVEHKPKLGIIHLKAMNTKTRQARSVGIHKDHSEELRALREIREPASPFVFPAMKNLETHRASQVIDKGWSKAKREAGIVGRMRFHDLRHTAATNYAKHKVDGIHAAEILGMDLKIYQHVYVKLTVNDLFDSIESLVTSQLNRSHSSGIGNLGVTRER